MKKRILSLFLALCMISCVITALPTVAGAAASGTCGDNLTWTLDDAGTLTISGTGDMFYVSKYATSPWYNVNSKIKTVIIEDGITSIKYNGFYNCTGLTGITIPPSIKYIDEYAFSNCISLKNIYISDMAAWCGISFKSLNANPLCYGGDLYLNNKLQNNISIPEGTNAIGDYAFYNCTGLTSITVPDSVTNIGKHAFYKCTNLETIKIGNGVKLIGDSAFQSAENLKGVYIKDLAAWCNIDFVCNGYNGGMANPLYYAKKLYLNNILLTELIIPQNITDISAFAFYNCEEIKSVTVPDSITSIGQSAFGGCSALSNVYITDLAAWCNVSFENAAANPVYNGAGLYLNGIPVTDVEIPSDVISIGNAFSGCTSLSNVVIPDSVTYIGDNEFRGCIGLESVTISNGITKIGDSAFSDCSRLNSITIPDSVMNIGRSAFDNTAYYNDDTNWENGVLYIGNHLIRANTKLNGEYEVKPGTICIADCAFDSYVGLISVTSITLPDSLISIGWDAFAYCTRLESIVIPDSVTNISTLMFSHCTGLTSVTLPRNISSIPAQTFYGCSSLENVTIPSNATSIGDGAFYGCSSLTDVYYLGTEEEWKAIDIGGNNTYLTNAAIHYLMSNITYYANKGANAPKKQPAMQGTEVKLATNIPTRTGHIFLGWAISADAAEAQYQPGDTITVGTEDIALYAVWKETTYTTTSKINGIFMVTPTNVPAGSSIMLVCFKEGRLVHIEKFEYDGSAAVPFFVNTEYDKVRVFVWDEIGSMIPVTEPEDVL